MHWFTFSLLSVFMLATAELMQQHLLNQDSGFNERTSGVLTFLFQAFFSFPLILLLGLGDQIQMIFLPNLLWRAVITGVMASVAMIFYLRSFKVTNISISTIFVSLSVVISTTLGILFFSESMGIPKFFGIAFILFAIISLKFKNLDLEPNHFWGLVAGVCFGVVYTFDKSIVIHIHPLVYLMWAVLLAALFGFLGNPKSVINSLQDKDIIAYRPVFISAFAYFLYNISTFSAYYFGGEVGRIDAINNSQVFLIILFEYFILKRTTGVRRKVFAAGLAFVGVGILGSF